MIPHADEGAKHLVLRGDEPQLRQGLAFGGGRGQLHRRTPNGGGHRRFGQGPQRCMAQRGEHRRKIGGLGTKMTAGKSVQGIQKVAGGRHA